MPEFTVKGKKFHFPYTKEGIKKAISVKSAAGAGGAVARKMHEKGMMTKMDVKRKKKTFSSLKA